MNEELKENIIKELCAIVEANPGLLKMFAQMDRLYRDVERIKREVEQIQHDIKPNHLGLLQDFAETMLYSLSEIESKHLMERKLHEQQDAIKQREIQLKEAEEAYQQVAAARSKEAEGVREETAKKDELLKEIKNGLTGFCSLPKTQRWQLILNEESIISHLRVVEQKIDMVMGTR